MTIQTTPKKNSGFDLVLRATKNGKTVEVSRRLQLEFTPEKDASTFVDTPLTSADIEAAVGAQIAEAFDAATCTAMLRELLPQLVVG